MQCGAGLIDTLVALTLLALSLLGASATLIRTLGANRAAALQTTAVDLAADLAEDTQVARALFDQSNLIQDWRSRIANELPGAPARDQNVTDSEVSLSWWDPAMHGPTGFALSLAESRATAVP
jgi:Tfp pilus assembly protein PilV